MTNQKGVSLSYEDTVALINASTTTVYVCFAETGCPGDYMEVALHGYQTEREAKDFVVYANRLAKELLAKCQPEENLSSAFFGRLRERFPAGWLRLCPDLDSPGPKGWEFNYKPIRIMPVVTLD